jgi:uncharacterized protein (TIGR03437 family)
MPNRVKRKQGLILVLTLVFVILLLQPPSYGGEINPRKGKTRPGAVLRSTVTKIRRAALGSSSSDMDRPLPLAAHWNAGTEHKESFNPSYQIRMIEEGHCLLPWFQMPSLYAHPDDPRWIDYYEGPIKRAAALGLPISFVGTQWEILLYSEDAYFNLPPDQNPNVVEPDSSIRRQLSPFGPPGPWQDAGRRWTSTPMMKKLQEWYPSPPLVVFVSNNEAYKLPWKEVEDDYRYRTLYPTGGDDFFKMKVVGDGWIERYRTLQQGMREGLTQSAWKNNARFMGYDAFGPRHFARWWGWWEFGLPAPGRIDPAPLTWDGGSPSYYIYNWQGGSSEYKILGPEVEAMNWVFMLKQAYELNPEFWFELSSWDGHEPELDSDKRKEFSGWGQTWNPGRYGGMIQFGMWLTRPRSVREFRGYRDTLLDSEAYFQAVVESVDRVHKHADLKRFWQLGNLVPNRSRTHYYQAGLFGYDTEDRWFLLNTNLDPAPETWGYFTEFPVLSLALVLGESPARQWLVYAHAPVGERRDVIITLPDFGDIKVDVSPAGSFFLVDEATREVRPISLPQRPGVLAFTNAASYRLFPSPGSQAVAWGSDLSSVNDLTLTISPLPGSGQEITFPCQILYAGPTQVNFVLPALHLPPSQGGVIRAYHGQEPVASGWITFTSVRPGLYTANANGQGVAAGYVIHRDTQNRDSTEPIFEGTPGSFTPKPIVKRQNQLFLVLYGTGGKVFPWDYAVNDQSQPVCRSSGSKQALINDVEVPILYYGETSEFPGVDQINIDLTNQVDRLPHGQELPVQAVINDCFGAIVTSNLATIRLGY